MTKRQSERLETTGVTTQEDPGDDSTSGRRRVGTPRGGR